MTNMYGCDNPSSDNDSDTSRRSVGWKYYSKTGGSSSRAVGISLQPLELGKFSFGLINSALKFLSFFPLQEYQIRFSQCSP